MPPRYSWKGFIRLSLVTIPVRSYNAVESSSDIHLNQLHKVDHARIQYKKFCPVHGEVTKDDIVSGYEYAKGQYVVVEPEELDKLYRESDKAITIDGFIKPETIDPVYYTGRTNYLLPDGGPGLKPYELLQEGMAQEDLYGIARVVQYGKENLLLLRSMGRLLLMTMIHYPEEVRDPAQFEGELPPTKADKDEIQLTKTLIGAKKLARFDISKYKDTFDEKLRELIQAKVEGREIVTPPSPEEPQVINIMDALKKSLAQAGAPAGGREVDAGEGQKRGASKRKMAPSHRERASAHVAHAKKRKKTG